MYFTEEQREAESYRLLQKGFFIPRATRHITLDTEPIDGVEFIHKGRLENNLYPLPSSIEATEKLSSPERTISTTLLFRKETQDFAHFAMKLKGRKELLVEKFLKVVQFPDISDEKAWCTFCLGSEMSSKIFEEIENEEDEKPPNLPLISIVVHLNQFQIIRLITYHHKWIQSAGMTVDVGRWLYALFLLLQKPVKEDFQKFLEEFHDFFERKFEMGEREGEDVVYLILLAILKYYFGVKYYKKGISLSRYLDRSYYDPSSSEYSD